MSQGLFSIGGISSGLDTAGIIDQLMALERQPLARIERRQASLNQVSGAWTAINTRLSALRTSLDAIARPDRFDDFMKVTSSDPSAVSVTRSGTTTSSNLSFTVEQLATRTQVSAGDVFTSRDEAIGTRALTLTIGGEPTDLTAGLTETSTLDDLVTAINDADLGVRATALRVDTDDYRLVLDATATGSDGSFTVAATGEWTGVFDTSEGLDAQVRVGNILVTRSSNTIDDLVDGATITLHETTAADVTISAQRDVDGAIEAVKGFVEALNSTMKTIRDLSSYDAESETAGVLQGNFMASQLGMSLRTAFSSPIVGLEGLAGLPSNIGLDVGRDGVITVDDAKLRAAFTDDWAGTSRMFSRTASSTSDAVIGTAGTSSTTPGTYEVQVSRAAAVAQATGSAPFPTTGPTEPKTFRITRNGVSASVTLDTSHTTVASAVAAINDALREAKITTITASGEEEGPLQLTDSQYGSASAFTVEELVLSDPMDETSALVPLLDVDGNPEAGTAFGLAGQYVGVDIEGTIDGVAASGSGRMLVAESGPAKGLNVSVDGAPVEPFDVTFSQGIAGGVGTELARAEGASGIVARARASVDSQVAIYQTRIDGFEQRLITREATIRRQFVGMETMLGQLNAQGNWLEQQLAGLANLNPQQRR